MPRLSGAPSVSAWDPTAQCVNLLGIVDGIAASAEPLRQAFWSTTPSQRDVGLSRLRFVAPYRHVAGDLATLESWYALLPQVARNDEQLAQSAETGVYTVELAKAIAGLPQEAQAWLSTRRAGFEAEVSKRRAAAESTRLAKDVADIKFHLKQSIEKDMPEPDVEARISKLPADLRADVEFARQQYTAEHAVQLAAAQRRQQLQQAIAWRKEEIDSGQVNPAAVAQRRESAEIREGVLAWELPYQIDKRVSGVRKELTDTGRVKLEERRRKSTGVDQLGSDHSAAARALMQVKREHPRFTITGKIQDRERDSVLVVGRAIPEGGNVQVFGTLLEATAIQVLHPDAERMNPMYYMGGTHYFIDKGRATNSRGAPVPLWIYGGPPAALIEAQDLADKLEGKIKTVERHLLEEAMKRCTAFAETPSRRYMQWVNGRVDYREIIVDQCLSESGDLDKDLRVRYWASARAKIERLKGSPVW